MRNLDVHLISSRPPLRSHTTAHVRFTPESGQRADMVKLRAKGLTPLDVVNAVNAQNLPSGLAKIGDTQYTVRNNARDIMGATIILGVPSPSGC
jgi:hypothetical protein